eukprot:4705400-Amphidinium_carterae.1
MGRDTHCSPQPEIKTKAQDMYKVAFWARLLCSSLTTVRSRSVCRQREGCQPSCNNTPISSNIDLLPSQSHPIGITSVPWHGGVSWLDEGKDLDFCKQSMSSSARNASRPPRLAKKGVILAAETGGIDGGGRDGVLRLSASTPSSNS